MASAQEIRNKISSVKNTQKITNAMQMVAASKMRRTQDRMAEGRPYSEKMRQVIGHLANCTSEYKHPYLQERPVNRVGYIVVSTDKGLCGGLNINLFRHLVNNMKQWHDQNIEIDLCLIGLKATAFFRNMGGNVVATMTRIGETPEVEELIGGIKVMLDDFNEGKIDKLYLSYNKFVSTMLQKPTTDQLLPLPPDEDEHKEQWDYLYEPDARDLMNNIMGRYIESLVYQAVLENSACEQAAKMLAMKNATENAGDLIKQLELDSNKARQAAITQELSEIVGGAAAI